MPKRLPTQKTELNDAAIHAIYKAIREREIFQSGTGESGATEHQESRVRFYFSTWSDSASPSEARWQEVFEELRAARRHPDPEFSLPSERTFDLAEEFIKLKLKGTITPPEITLDGDGNLYLEWKSNRKRLSICLSDDPAGRYIYLGVGREYEAFPLTDANLQRAIESHLA